MAQNSSGKNAGIVVLVVGLVLLVPCLLGAIGLAGAFFWLKAAPTPPPPQMNIQAAPETLFDAAPVRDTPVDETPAESSVETTDPDDPSRLSFDVKPGEWPLKDSIVLRGPIAVFSSQFSEEWGEDVEFLETLKFDNCFYGAAECEVYPFICSAPSSSNPLTGRDLVQAVKAKHFRSKYIKSLDRGEIRFPGYHPGTNDEVHNDFNEQFVFTHEDEAGESDGVRGELKRYVVDGQLWYVVLHTTPQPHEEFMFSEYVILKSPHGDHCVGVVTHQVCHNLCD